MPRRALPTVIATLLLFSVACGKNSSPTGPSGGGAAAISMSGDLNFGDVELGSSAVRTFRVTNTGEKTMTITGFGIGEYADHFAVDWTNGTIAPGATQTVNLVFTPLVTGPIATTLQARGDFTIGTGRLQVNGRGVRTGPLWEGWGTGPYVFDMPRFISRVRVTANYSGRCENFAVRVGGRLIVNTILGTCSVAEGPSYNGVHAVTGGEVEVLHAAGVNWRITEHRD